MKVVPPDDILAREYGRTWRRAVIRLAAARARDQARGQSIAIPPDLRQQIQMRITGQPLSWTEALARLLRHPLEDQGR